MNTEKPCSKCKEVKPLKEFHKFSAMKDGHRNECITCYRLLKRQHREKNIAYIRDFDRKRGNRQTPEYRKKFKELNPEKIKAKQMINNGIRDGKLTRPNICEGCLDTCKPHGHHEDYSKPMTVVWLCPSCHRTTHTLEKIKEVLK